MENDRAEIMLIDAHGLIIQGIRRVLENIPNVEVQLAVTSIKEACKVISARQFDLYIMDIEFPDGNGFELINTIKSSNSNARIIVNTMHEEIWLMNRLINLDVDAVVLKSSDVKDMEKAVSTVLSGESYYCPRFDTLRRKLRSQLCLGQLKGDIPTTRELEVLNAIAQGYSTSQIAKQLSISENTVETFRKKLMQKFNAKNAIDMIMKAINQGWVTP